MEFSEDTYNRSWNCLIEAFGCSPEEAQQMLLTFRLFLKCGLEIKGSVPLQAAFITALNAAARSFLGGVFYHLPEGTPCLLPWPGNKTLNQVAEELGGIKYNGVLHDIPVLNFGQSAGGDNQVVADSWRGGIMVQGELNPLGVSGNLPLGGIFAGGLAAGHVFLKTAGLYPQALGHSAGISLWNPALHWTAPGAEGPSDVNLPGSVWLLGLGHLGQAYLWALGLLPYAKPKEVNVFLQDYDKIIPANIGAALLCTADEVNNFKTRVSSNWLEARSFQTRIIERPFDERTKVGRDEPRIALCGFDNAEARLLLEKAGFDYIIEAGLGESATNFDKIFLHTFPSNLHRAEDLWLNVKENSERKIKLAGIIGESIKTKTCGVLAEALAGKAVSVPFVGACAGALVIAELIKGFNKGVKTEKIVLHLRVAKQIGIANRDKDYNIELGRSKYQKSKSLSEIAVI